MTRQAKMNITCLVPISWLDEADDENEHNDADYVDDDDDDDGCQGGGHGCDYEPVQIASMTNR